MAFDAAARGAFQEAYRKAGPVIHEPIMRVSVETPTGFQGGALKLLNQRRGMIVGTQEEDVNCTVEAQVPLAEMFGFSNVLRSATQGQAQFTMEFLTYREVPRSVAEELEKQKTRKQEK
jgi:elongation factor G